MYSNSYYYPYPAVPTGGFNRYAPYPSSRGGNYGRGRGRGLSRNRSLTLIAPSSKPTANITSPKPNVHSNAISTNNVVPSKTVPPAAPPQQKTVATAVPQKPAQSVSSKPKATPSIATINQEKELLDKIASIAGLINKQKRTVAKRLKQSKFSKFLAPRRTFSNRSLISAGTQGSSKAEFIKTSRNKLIRSGYTVSLKPKVSISKISAKRFAALKAKKGSYVPQRTMINGVTFVKTSNGTSLIRKNETAKKLASMRVKQSLKTIQQSKKKKIQYCLFYTKFGKCNKINECKYIHDPNKVAICRKFLKGACNDTKCLLQHKVQADRMPVCSYFLRGVCTTENCPYLHVNVNPKAAVCEAFLKGYCPDGENCKLKHVLRKKKKEDQPNQTTPKENLTEVTSSGSSTTIEPLQLRPRFSDDSDHSEEEEDESDSDNTSVVDDLTV